MYQQLQFIMQKSVVVFTTICLCIMLFVFATSSEAQVNHAPVIKNSHAQQRAGTRIVDITYDVEDADGDLLTIIIYASKDNGLSFDIIPVSITGLVLKQILPPLIVILYSSFINISI